MQVLKFAMGALLVIAAGSAQAQSIFLASDTGAGPSDPRPLSNAKAAQFDAAALLFGPETVVNFESAPLGVFSSLTVAPGVTVSGADYYGTPLTINNAPSYLPNPAVGGFNTTAGGSNYLYLRGGTATFTFAAPVQSFGAYFTGIQPFFFKGSVRFNDGTSQSIGLTADDLFSGSVSFAGFTDAGKSVSQVSIDMGSQPGGGDFVGIDDVRFSGAVQGGEIRPFAPVPELPSGVPFAAGVCFLGGALAVSRKRRSRAVARLALP
jgi:hypothetical protein